MLTRRLRVAVKDLLDLSQEEIYYLEEVTDEEFRARYGVRDCLHGDEVSSALQEQLAAAQRGEDTGDDDPY